MLQIINGKTVYVVDFDTMPELPITGEGEEAPYAAALTHAIASGMLTEPGKYGIEMVGIGGWKIHTIDEPPLSKGDEIIQEAIKELTASNIPDTTQNRLWMLQGIQSAWNEDPTVSLEKTLYKLALRMEIHKLQKALKKEMAA